jgi:hypothetical protein
MRNISLDCEVQDNLVYDHDPKLAVPSLDLFPYKKRVASIKNRWAKLPDFFAPLAELLQTP